MACVFSAFFAHVAAEWFSGLPWFWPMRAQNKAAMFCNNVTTYQAIRIFAKKHICLYR
jgi:hypothetical protein